MAEAAWMTSRLPAVARPCATQRVNDTIGQGEPVTTRRRLLLRTGASTLALPACLAAWAANSPPIVGLLLTGSKRAPRTYPVFVETLRSLGWVDGKSVKLEDRWDDGDAGRLPEMARELVRLNVDVIVAPENPAVHAALRATSTIPIVTVAAIDPVGQGFGTSLRRPGKNVTGTMWDQEPKIVEKYPELLKEMVPALKRMGSIAQEGYRGLGPYRDALESAANRLGIEVHRVEMRAIGDLEPAMQSLVAQGVQGVFCYGSILLWSHRSDLAASLKNHRLPDIQIDRAFVGAGALMSYGVSVPDLARRAAGFVDRILKGANPAETPFEQPTKYELVINRKRADSLGLKIPQTLLVRADEVIE